MKKIAIFYHVLQKNNWKELFVEQMEGMRRSGLYDAADHIHVGINGDEHGSPVTDYPKIKVNYNAYQRSAKDTMTSIHEFCQQNSDYAVLYFCNLGVTHYKGPWSEHKIAWRKYLSFFVIDRWESCVRKLENHDCVGTQWCEFAYLTEDYQRVHAPHFEGEFWWATSEYIKTLDPRFLDENINVLEKTDNASTYYRGEFWIGSRDPKVFNFYTSTKTPYFEILKESDYTKYADSEKSYDITKSGRESMKTKPKIAMISMFKNESKTIGTMLESVVPYISYWVLQDNGSTDGTPDVVKAWAEKYKIPGLLYKVEEGWVGFGWNRDHALQTLRKQDHGCDWIMKMDCDEYLEVEDGFDWSIFEQTDIPSFDVHAFAPGCQYFRTWIWNSKLNWSINHDPAHETIVLDGNNQEFRRHQLDLKFKMMAGSVAGESYSNPTKYINDALKLEEKLIRENSMLQNMYHFWYIGKSYEDGYVCKELPLGVIHQKEMARRCIFYFEEVLHVSHPDFKNTRKAVRHDEMGYYAMDVMGTASRFLGDYHKAIEYYNGAEQFAPSKNDHLVHLAETYWELMDYEKMLQVTTRLVDPNRTNPFPDLGFVINPNFYVNTGKHPQFLHDSALRLNKEVTATGTIFRINQNSRKKLFVVDNFYDDPHKVREYALKQDFNGDLRFYKGKRTGDRFSTPQIRQKFEQILGEPIVRWDTPGSEFGGSMNGVFQYCTPEDALVYHYDSQKWAAMIFLTPDAPPQTGTSFYRHKETGIKVAEDLDADRAFAGGFYDATKFELIDTVGNVFNRCVIFDARAIHAATEYFGKTIEDSRLFHIFFFD